MLLRTFLPKSVKSHCRFFYSMHLAAVFQLVMKSQFSAWIGQFYCHTDISKSVMPYVTGLGLTC